MTESAIRRFWVAHASRARGIGILPMGHGLEAHATSNRACGIGILPMGHGLEANVMSNLLCFRANC